MLSPHENAFSETFMQAHRHGISANISYLYRGYWPYRAEDGVIFAPRSCLLLLTKKAASMLIAEVFELASGI